MMVHSRKHPYLSHVGNWKVTSPFGCPNTLTVITNKFICGGRVDLFWSDPMAKCIEHIITFLYVYFPVRLLLAYIMIPIIQKEIDTFVDVVWNSHRIREQKNSYLPDGVPNHIYSFAEKYGLEECGM
jgi:hypothetical protein